MLPPDLHYIRPGCVVPVHRPGVWPACKRVALWAGIAVAVPPVACAVVYLGCALVVLRVIEGRGPEV